METPTSSPTACEFCRHWVRRRVGANWGTCKMLSFEPSNVSFIDIQLPSTSHDERVLTRDVFYCAKFNAGVQEIAATADLPPKKPPTSVKGVM